MKKPGADEQETLPERGPTRGITTVPELAEPPRLDNTEERRALVQEALCGGGGEPARVGRFTIEKRIGAGGMGVVYAALDAQLDRRVAIKLVRTRGGGEERERLLPARRRASRTRITISPRSPRPISRPRRARSRARRRSSA